MSKSEVGGTGSRLRLYERTAGPVKNKETQKVLDNEELGTTSTYPHLFALLSFAIHRRAMTWMLDTTT
jgi:hypothetical protein